MWKRKKKNAGLWGTGKEMASRPDDPAELMHWRQEAVHCIAFVEPGINGSTVYFLLLLMPACPVTAWWGRLYKAPQSKPQTSLTFNHWPCTDLSSGQVRTTGLQLCCTFEPSTIPHSTDLRIDTRGPLYGIHFFMTSFLCLLVNYHRMFNAPPMILKISIC